MAYVMTVREMPLELQGDISTLDLEIKHEVRKDMRPGFHISEDGVLGFKGRICVPDDVEIKKQIFYEAHNAPYAMHPDATNYVFPQIMSRDFTGLLRNACWVRPDSGGDRGSIVARWVRVFGADGDYGGLFDCEYKRACKAIHLSGGATSVLLRDAMTRAPVVRFNSAKRASELKFFLEDPENFETLSIVFNSSQLPMSFSSTSFIFFYYMTGNFCSDKKPAAVNWIEGLGKSVVCKAVINEEVVKKVLKTNIHALVELNMLKNLAGFAIAGALSGYNAHASNIVSAVFIATGQDPAQNIESSHCITMMEAINNGKDLHVSVTMPSIEVGIVGGGTQLTSQSACLNLLGVKGASKESPGANSRLLATIVAGSVLAGELSLMSAGQLAKSHMKYNRSSKDMSKVTC
ncbi:3-hydroxy-3-methylglutaryl-coenzyme A reductase 1-like [Humulus lupulus]|uniref:3-hydroxy-3-methylglutaryl-coenzyme A reductase 1-like n=1 Tax=Humulus lupulus TaxID=3486 RepID=UPI002B417DDC|nr:3-hydroxy-3-methylglutaryl-coenzyme A reductase 1-like [Humulus lupulus]